MKTRTVIETTSRVGAGALFALALGAPAAGQITTRASVDSAGVQGDDESNQASISADGRYVAFSSFATNLVPGDTNAWRDIFVHDRQTGQTELVSVDSAGAQGDEHCWAPRITPDGRFVVFVSAATTLVPGDTNAASDHFVHDRQSGTTERVSVDSSGAQVNFESKVKPSISDDGRYVAFTSSATNLVLGDTNGVWDIFVRDRQSGSTERASVSSGGAQTDGHSSLRFANTMSADGRYVAFESDATNLVAGDTNAESDIFVRDRQLGITERISLDSAGMQGNDWSDCPSISADGRYVAFRSFATNLVPGDTNVRTDIFVRDRQTGSTERVSLTSAGAQGTHHSNGLPAISSDGRYVAFGSFAANLVPGDSNGTTDMFIRDRQLGTTERVSVGPGAAQANDWSLGDAPSISSDGRFVAFESDASNLVSGDTNGVDDIFVRDREVIPFTTLCHPGVGGVISCPCGQPANPTGGCANFGAGSTSGAVLSASGAAYVAADSVLLTTSNHRSPAGGVLNVFFSFKPGTVTTGVASGAGVRCTSGGDLKRLYTLQVFGGSGSKPGMGDSSVSARSASLPGHAIVAPETRYYFNVYRDGQASGPCGSSAVSTNLTNTVSVSWVP
ncbi:MAG: TolB family protein [Planctomycetota bacterium]